MSVDAIPESSEHAHSRVRDLRGVCAHRREHGRQLVDKPRAGLFHAADHVIFQSAFCRLSADRFCGRGEAAGARAAERFDSRRWIARHVELFEELRRR